MAFPFGSDTERATSTSSASSWTRAFDWFDSRRREFFRKRKHRSRQPGGGASKAPGFRMEALEPRLLLSADAAPFLVDMPGGDGADYSLKYDGLTQSFRAYDQQADTLVSQRQLQELSYVKVSGTTGDDELTLDFSDGYVSPVDIRFDGKGGSDRLTLTGNGLDSVTLTLTDDIAGTLELDTGTGIVTVSLTGVETVTDTTDASQKILADTTDQGHGLRIEDSGSGASAVRALTSSTGLMSYEVSGQTDIVTVQMGAGDDTFEHRGLEHAVFGTVLVDGGAGSDAVTGPPDDTTWNITGANAGDVAGVSFVSVETLRGSADNEDTFVVSGTGSLSGVADGGAGGFDSLILNGSDFSSVEYVAFDAHSGTVARDGDVLEYAGLEPITDNMDVADRVIDLSEFDDTATLSQSGNQYTIASTDPFGVVTFESVTFTQPSSSLTINLGEDLDIPILSRDRLEITGTVDLSGTDLIIEGQDGKDEVAILGTLSVDDLTVNAEEITVSGTVTSGGNVILNADEEDDGAILPDDGSAPAFLSVLEGLFVALPEAIVDLSGGTISASGDLTITADAVANVNASPSTLGSVLDASLITILPTAEITMTGTTITAANVSAAATATITASFEDQATDDDTDTTSDAAVTVIVVEGGQGNALGGGVATILDDDSSISTGGDVVLSATTTMDIDSVADGSGGSAGATLAVTEIGIETTVQVGGTATIGDDDGDNPDSISITATTTADVVTASTSTANGAEESGGGENSSNQSEQRLADPNQDSNTSDQAASSEGSLSFAGAVVVSDYRPSTEAEISTSGAITTDGALTLGATSTDSVSATANGSNTGSGGTGVGVAVAIGIVDPTVSATLSGGSLTATDGIGVSATMNAGETFTVTATSGAGDSTDVGVAGSLAIQSVTATVEANVSGTVDLNGSDLSATATATTSTSTSALPDEDGLTAESLGIGASIALAIIDVQTTAAIAADAAITNGAALTLTATGNHTIETQATGGAEASGSSATVLTPVVAISLLFSDTQAEIGTGASALSFSGAVDIGASHTASADTNAEGDAEGGSTAIGASLALSIDEQTSTVSLLRDLTSTGGAVALVSTGVMRARSDAKAAASGAAEDDQGDASDDNQVNQQSQAQTDFANQQSQNRTGSQANNQTAPEASNEDGNGGGGSVSVAAAISINVQSVDVGVDLGSGLVLVADGAATMAARSNVDSAAIADGSASDGSSGTVGAAVALNVQNVTTDARTDDAT
ncbi:MAG: LEPR-XLL domain-containing protein, partial [Pseudomonadota bacterium]